MSKVWELDLESTAKMVLLALADHCDGEGMCYPKISTLTTKTNLSRNTVIKKLKQLQECNYLVKTSQYYENGAQRQNLYQIMNVCSLDEGVSSRNPGGIVTGRGEYPCDTPNKNHHINHHKETKEKDREMSNSQKARTQPGAVERIFEFWKEHCKHPYSGLDDGRRKKIKSMLKLYTEQRLMNAIRGAALSEFHQGDNDRNKKFDDISLICRDANHVDEFIIIYERHQLMLVARQDQREWREREIAQGTYNNGI
ncbi:MAG: helix-turn-helix domain-containing protein [Saprospiraceae bacterium]|nr:helix-turn-helix domain-containing protein [Saprospiraceae bacterium]